MLRASTTRTLITSAFTHYPHLRAHTQEPEKLPKRHPDRTLTIGIDCPKGTLETTVRSASPWGEGLLQTPLQLTHDRISGLLSRDGISPGDSQDRGGTPGFQALGMGVWREKLRRSLWGKTQ